MVLGKSCGIIREVRFECRRSIRELYAGEIQESIEGAADSICLSCISYIYNVRDAEAEHDEDRGFKRRCRSFS